jgi:hypothetical protein
MDKEASPCEILPSYNTSYYRRNRERLAAKALERYHRRVRKAKLEAAVVELQDMKARIEEALAATQKEILSFNL